MVVTVDIIQRRRIQKPIAVRPLSNARAGGVQGLGRKMSGVVLCYGEAMRRVASANRACGSRRSGLLSVANSRRSSACRWRARARFCAGWKTGWSVGVEGELAAVAPAVAADRFGRPVQGESLAERDSWIDCRCTTEKQTDRLTDAVGSSSRDSCVDSGNPE